jgi:hypothetical protein
VFEQVVGFAEHAEVVGGALAAVEPVEGVVEVGADGLAGAAGAGAGAVAGLDPAGEFGAGSSAVGVGPGERGVLVGRAGAGRREGLPGPGEQGQRPGVEDLQAQRYPGAGEEVVEFSGVGGEFDDVASAAAVTR